jgi:dTDP-4-dehydrorhamnose reductase
MKILILGAKGMLGQQLVRAFSDMGEVSAWDKEEIDLAKADETSRAITALMPDVLVNAAAYNDVDAAEGEKEGETAKRMNGDLVGALADICQILAITMVHYSTDYVFEGTKQEGYVESDAPNPEGAYARSKHLGERLLKMSGAEHYLIRTSRLFGPAGASALAKTSFVDKVLDLAKTRDTIELVDEELSCPTYAPDLAKATRDLVAAKKPFGSYHVTNAGACTWYGFGKKIIELAGLRTAVTPVPGSAFPRAAPRPRYSVLRSTKLPPLRPWEEALQEYLALSTQGSGALSAER